MKHIALPARRAGCRAPYTTPGLGDRIHSVILGWAYSQAHNTPVTLHLTADKWSGGQFGNKPESWREIVGLLPDGSVAIKAHDLSPESEVEWLTYLARKGFDAIRYHYSDYPGQFEQIAGVNIAPYFARIPRLQAAAQNINLPERFFTVQWDSNAKSRTISPAQRAAVLERYQAHGLTPVIVGGEAKDDRFRWSLKNIAHAMARAEFHVGADSAFFHMAQLFMEWGQIHLYSDGPKSHHVLRAVDNGAQLNRYL